MGVFKNYTIEAIDKIEKELRELNEAGKASSKAKAVAKETAETLIIFCGQDNEFAQAIVQSDKTLSEACEYAVKDCGNSISDIAVYRRAVEFYFPGATVEMKMTIDLCGSVKGKGTVIDLSFDELFD